MPRQSGAETKGRALETAVAQIQRQFGDGAIMRLGEGHPVAPVEVISTGALSLDAALGVGGIPCGRVTEIYGPEGAVEAGYLDRIVPAERLAEEAMAETERLAGLPRPAFSETKQRVRGASAERIRRSLVEELGSVGGAGS